VSGHTPGPWLAYNSDNGRILKHWRIKGDCVRNEPAFAIIDSGGKISPEYEAANARLIVRAVNCHEELLEALKIAVKALKDHDIDESMAGEFEILTDAVEKAEGR